ncbi:cilia- and flagella-associated protein 45 [Drosophila suzukii]|uniref:Cilia- and flagella-associated protein 45 n=1 Tax=Drosophila suzukii TaxID=28584 RepID=A0AB39Z3Q9_DROSZ
MNVCKPKEVGPDGLFVRKRFTRHPVVISAKRFAAIQGRSRQDEKHAQLEAVEEERRYRQYLKDGNDLLCSLFSDPTVPKVKKSARAKNKEAMAVVKDVDTKLADERLRKQRIIRANNLLEQLKPGPRALHQALLLSEMIHQRSYNEALNKEIADAARSQEQADEELCPAALVPFGHATEEEEVARQTAKNQEHAQLMREDIKQREKIREAEREQRIFEVQVDRAQYKCLQDKEEKALKEKKARKIAFYRKAHRDSIQEKAEIAEHERICDAIDDRRNCVYIVASRNLNTRYGSHVKQLRQKRQEEREEQALRVSQVQKVMQKKLEERQEQAEDRHAFETQVDENRRQCELQMLAKERRAYQLKEREQDAEKLRRERELQRFHVARRLKNAEANRYFEASQKRKRDKVKEDLRNVLFGQREEFLEKRRAELMNLAACNEDPYLEDDKKFFEQAVQIMEESRKVGRPLYPIATAVERYERQNQLDMRPEGRIVKRSRLRDYCWPGFYSKAELAYRKYEQREMCREEQVADRHQIYCNSVKIKKLAEVEKPYSPCVASCPINCFHRRGMPATDSQDSFDYDRHVCYTDPPTVGACPIPMQVIHNDPLDNQRKISQQSMKLPPMPKDLAKRERPSFRSVAREVMSAHNQPEPAPSAKESKISLRGAPPPASPVTKPSKTTPPETKTPPEPPLPKSQPPVRPRVKRGSKRASSVVKPPPTGNDRPAPVPNPTGTWGSGSLQPAAKKKSK